MDGNNLGRALQERRKARGLTLQQVSISSGVSAAHIGRIERGDRFPSGRILRKLAHPLGFTEIELLKLAGFLSRDETDERLDRFKTQIKRDIAHALVSLYRKVDSLGKEVTNG